MPTDFKIVPSSPEPVSGLSLIDQIENAVNDLGGQYDDLETEVNSKTDQALTASLNAEATSNSALQTAQDAETLANEAQNVAVSALNKADQVQIVADGAAVKADSAYDQATLALTDSQTALIDSQTALGQSETALEQSTAAMQTAENAQTSSQAAMEASNQAIGTFIVDDDLYDADTVSIRPTKRYLTNTENNNFPNGLVFPVFFEVLTSSDGLSITQRCWGTPAAIIFSRTGKVSSPDQPTVIWEAWGASIQDWNLLINKPVVYPPVTATLEEVKEGVNGTKAVTPITGGQTYSPMPEMKGDGSIGDFQVLTTEIGGSLTLPKDGTWLAFTIQYSAGGRIYSHLPAQLLAGGSVVTAQTGYRKYVTIWRIR